MEALLLLVIIVILVGIGPFVGFVSWIIAIGLIIAVIVGICNSVSGLFGESTEAEGQRLHDERMADLARTKQMIEDHNKWLRDES